MRIPQQTDSIRTEMTGCKRNGIMLSDIILNQETNSDNSSLVTKKQTDSCLLPETYKSIAVIAYDKKYRFYEEKYVRKFLKYFIAQMDLFRW